MTSPQTVWGGVLHSLDLSQCTAPISVPEIIPGLARGEVCVLSAPGGSGKSFFLLEAALGFASGRRTVFPLSTPPMRTLYLGCQDDVVRLHNRMVDILHMFPRSQEQMGNNLGISFYRGPRPALVVQGAIQPHAVDDLKRLCEGLDILILDPLSKMHACNENDNYQMDMVTDVLCSVADETQTTIILSHHSGKGESMDVDGKKKRGLNARGASSLVDGVRLVLYLVVGAGKVGGTEKVVLRWAKNNYGERPEEITYKRWPHGVLVPPWWSADKQGRSWGGGAYDDDDVPF